MAMKQIWKFPLPFDGAIEMPMSAMPISVQVQHEQPVIWAIVDPTEKKIMARFHVAGTGHTLPDGLGPFLGTFQTNGGALVFHVFRMD